MALGFVKMQISEDTERVWVVTKRQGKKLEKLSCRITLFGFFFVFFCCLWCLSSWGCWQTRGQWPADSTHVDHSDSQCDWKSGCVDPARAKFVHLPQGDALPVWWEAARQWTSGLSSLHTVDGNTSPSFPSTPQCVSLWLFCYWDWLCLSLETKGERTLQGRLKGLQKPSL